MNSAQGFGFSRRRHEARCAAAAAQEMPPAPAIQPGILEAAKLLLPKVDVGVDVEILQENDLVRFLHFSQKEMPRGSQGAGQARRLSRPWRWGQGN